MPNGVPIFILSAFNVAVLGIRYTQQECPRAGSAPWAVVLDRDGPRRIGADFGAVTEKASPIDSLPGYSASRAAAVLRAGIIPASCSFVGGDPLTAGGGARHDSRLSEDTPTEVFRS